MAITPPRVRFAPSPTGLLHVGGVRSALYNYLLARGSGGAFVLRIEDTDETREHPEAIDQIQRSLRWCGLDWDEGPGVDGPYAPYIQSERRASHTAAAERLLADGRAYRCWCTPEELEAERAEARAANRPHIYSRRCLSRSAEEIAALEAEGRRPAIRFRMPDEGEVVIDDLVRGETRWAIDLLGDHVIVRPGGVPTYNFANPVDDMGMQITHVLRGEDLLPSTPRQVLTYEALGAPVPRFAHLSMILGPDRKRLSKRHGATSVEAFRDAGYVSEAVVNYLALLGWSYDDSRELFTLPELVEAFSIERVNASAAVLDFAKLEWMNGVYLRAMPPEEYAERLLAYLAETGSDLAAQPEIVRRAAPLVQEKLATFAEFDGYCRFLFGPVEMDPGAWARVEGNERAGEILGAARADLAALPAWTTDALDGALRGLTERLGAKPKVAFTPIRVALTGRTVAPGLFESAEALGREETLARLDAAAARLAA